MTTQAQATNPDDTTFMSRQSAGDIAGWGLLAGLGAVLGGYFLMKAVPGQGVGRLLAVYAGVAAGGAAGLALGMNIWAPTGQSLTDVQAALAGQAATSTTALPSATNQGAAIGQQLASTS